MLRITHLTRLLASFLMMLSPVIHAQKQARWEAGGSFGFAGYLGDLNRSDLISKEFNFAFHGFGRRYISDQFAVKAGLTLSQISGSDLHYEERKPRNFSMSAPLAEASLMLEWDAFDCDPSYYPHNRNGGFSPYFFAGVAAVYTKPRVNFQETTSQNPDVLKGIVRDENTHFSYFNVAIPLGFGMKYNLNRRWVVSVETTYRLTFTDYLDCVSFSGNPNKTDAYQTFTFTVARRLGRAQYRSPRSTY